ncbi:MAG: hypothetical protein EBS38_05600 [Actinobacteria bacterium]|nr:hypothetical protein [Actinomycetota bacterium]
MPKKNRYKLDKEAAVASQNIVLEVSVTYDIKSDDMRAVIAVRKDAADNDEFLLRLGRALEKAARTVMPSYKEEMELLEMLAKLGKELRASDT